LGAHDVFRDAVPASGDMAALAEHAGTIGVFELDGVMIEDLAVLLAGSDLAAAHAPAAHRMNDRCPAGGIVWLALHDPLDDVKVVDVLFADVISGEPDEVVPVVHLVLHLGRRPTQLLREFLAFTGPHTGAVPVGARRADFTDGAVVEAFDRLEVHALVMALEADA